MGGEEETGDGAVHATPSASPHSMQRMRTRQQRAIIDHSRSVSSHPSLHFAASPAHAQWASVVTVDRTSPCFVALSLPFSCDERFC